jgi:peptidoglycan/LPS O-acetylase OafA/YrhL
MNASLLNLRFEPPAHPAAPRRDDALEGLRGCAALAVLYAHLTVSAPVLDPAYAPPAFFWHIEAAVAAVILFFLISGYVIGLTNERPFTRQAVASYLRRRALRLLPLYFFAVTLGWLASPGPSLRDLAGNFLLLQNAAPGSPFAINLLFGNSNLWSLHYEAIYYLLFIAVWGLRPRMLPLFALVFLIGALGVLAPGFSLWAAWLACGFLFWLVGLAVAWQLPPDSTAPAGPWPSAGLLALATWKLQILNAVLARMGHAIVWLPGITLGYLDSLPVLLWLFLLVTRRRAPWHRHLEAACWFLPILYLAWRCRPGAFPVWQGETRVAVCAIAVAIALRGWCPSLRFLERLAPFGAISYGIYAFGAPAQFLARDLLPSYAGRWWTYGLRVIAAVGLTFFLAWFFERWVQPRLRRWLQPARTTAAKPLPAGP